MRVARMSITSISRVFFVCDFFQPLDGLAVELLHYCDVRHGRGWRGAVPMLLTWRTPDHVARPNLLDRSAPTLYETASGRHNQDLTQWMPMPCGPRAWFECHAGAEYTRRIGCLEKRVDAHRAGKVLRGPLSSRLRTVSFDLHVVNPSRPDGSAEPSA